MEHRLNSRMVFVVTFATVLHATLITGIPLDSFFSFGLDVGDARLPKILDVSSQPIQLNISSFPYFGQDHDILYVNANGDISFLQPVGLYVPQPFPLNQSGFTRTTQIIAPFWADSDTRPEDGGDIWYRETDQANLLQRARNMIRGAFINQATFEPLSLFIATWDHVGVYRMITTMNNTFQCVLVTDGVRSFAMFLYADGLIQWLWSEDHEGIPAQVGFNAGDGIRFFSHPDSMTNRLSTIFETSNIGTPGVWLFRVDREDILAGGCSSDLDNAQITISPRIGNMLGGTGILISGLCFNESDFISMTCSIDNTMGEISFISETILLCVSPSLTKIGALSFVLKLTRILPVGSPGRFKSAEFTATFYSVSPERSYAVDFEPSDLLFSQEETYTLTWSPQSLLPSYIMENADPFTVDIEIYQNQFTGRRSRWSKVMNLISNHPNSGEAEVTIPAMSIACQYPKSTDIMFNVCPIALKVSVSTHLASKRDTQSENIMLPQSAGIWTGVAFLRSSEASDIDTRKVCDEWSTVEQIAGTGVALRNLLPCPPTLRLAQTDSNYEREDQSSIMGNTRYSQSSLRFFHPNLMSCYRQITPNENDQGQQCCYDNIGNLMILSPGGGSADSISPKSNFNMHLLEDLVPYVVCCKSGEGTSNCGAYYNHRPSGEAIKYVLPIPACIYGDPHIVTLDGLKYTFNGKGEFTLIESDDDSFILQGRMEQAVDSSGEDASGTVFTAIVAIQDETSTVVQFEIRPSGIRTIVDGTTVEFDDISEQNFVNVTITDKANGTVLATFSGGASIELKAENGIISLMLVSLPDHLKGHTRGLMGNYNGIASDDLVPKFGTEPIAPDSSLEDIHSMFGMTWIINEADTHFSYRPGDSWMEFYDPSFLPVFEPVFEDSALEEEAKSVCGEDKFCLFDVATTKRIEIGISTMNDNQAFNEIVELSEPIVCDPLCENGVCVENNTCRCAEGYSGYRCTQPVVSECGNNICENNGTCVQHVATFICMCPQGYIGAFCQNKEPPFHIRLINSSPRVSGNDVLIDFIGSMPIKSARCFLTGQPEQECTSKWIQYRGLPMGSYIFRVQATNNRNEKAVERRLIHITDEEDYCVVLLINEGVIVDGSDAVIQFKGRGPITSYICIIDKGSRKPCRSPVHYNGLEVGKHRVRVLPQGCNPRKVKNLSMKFFVN